MYIHPGASVNPKCGQDIFPRHILYMSSPQPYMSWPHVAKTYTGSRTYKMFPKTYTWCPRHIANTYCKTYLEDISPRHTHIDTAKTYLRSPRHIRQCDQDIRGICLGNLKYVLQICLAAICLGIMCYVYVLESTIYVNSINGCQGVLKYNVTQHIA